MSGDSMNGKWCVITGATSGLGKAAALELARLGSNLILIGRNEQAGQKLASLPNTVFVKTDLSSQSEVRSLAIRIIQTAPSIDVLINNAGARFDSHEENVDGIEMTMAVNHFGHFLLTSLLKESLLRAAEARVISLGSRVHLGASDEGGWILPRERFHRHQAYGKSKLANIMFAYELAEELGTTRVTSNAVDPGVVATNFARNNGLKAWLKHMISHGLKRELRSPKQGADTIIYLATSPDTQRRTGRYFRDRTEVDSSPFSQNREAAQRLWRLSLEKTGLDRF